MTDNKEEIDLTSPVKEIVNDTSAIDSKSQAQLRITELELELRQCRLDIEKESLDRIKKNSAGRTCIVWITALAMIAFYALLFFALKAVLCGAENTEPHVLITAMIISASIPTILLIALIKAAIFPVSQKLTENTKISDAAPVTKVIEALKNITD